VEGSWSLVANLGVIEIFGRIEKHLMESLVTHLYAIRATIAIITHPSGKPQSMGHAFQMIPNVGVQGSHVV
jgi:hypothetical protein